MKLPTIAVMLVAASSLAIAAHAADYMEQGERVKGRSYSSAVVTDGGRIVWLSGETTTTDLNGKDIGGISRYKPATSSR